MLPEMGKESRLCAIGGTDLSYSLKKTRKNCAKEAVVHLSNLAATYPHYIAIHNQSVNTSGKCHNYELLDQMLKQCKFYFRHHTALISIARYLPVYII